MGGVAIDRAPSLTRRSFHIGGGWVEAIGRGSIDVYNPATAGLLGSVPAGTPQDVATAVEAATDAAPGWQATSVADRAALLLALADRMRDRAEELAGLITAEVGSPLDFSRVQQVGLPIQVIEGVAGVLGELEWVQAIGRAQVVLEPVGVVGAITPWNYPLHQAVAKVAAAIGAGCTVVLKPSEVAPFSAYVLAELLDDVGLPGGVFNLVTGYGPVVGEAIAGHPGVDLVSLTGSGVAGRRVMEVAAPRAKRIALELGGKSATVMLDDADFASVIPGAVMHAFRNSGQNCSALSRLIVPRDRLAEVEAMAVAVAESVVVGDPTRAETQMGPLVSAAHLLRVRGHIQSAIDSGVRLIAGGLVPPADTGPGFYVRPTVFSPVRPDAQIAQDEVFGPVLAILEYADEDEAVRLANESRYGLSGAVWSADPERAYRVARRMRTGRVVVNGGPFNAAAPFGGVKQSGFGSELGRYGVEEFLYRKTLQL